MRDQRIIKKYPNRRLYDSAQSRYVTLADIRKLVMQRVRFAVIDQGTHANITRSVLLQAILDQQQTGKLILTRAFLERVIRSGRRKR